MQLHYLQRIIHPVLTSLLLLSLGTITFTCLLVAPAAIASTLPTKNSILASSFMPERHKSKQVLSMAGMFNSAMSCQQAGSRLHPWGMMPQCWCQLQDWCLSKICLKTIVCGYMTPNLEEEAHCSMTRIDLVIGQIQSMLPTSEACMQGDLCMEGRWIALRRVWEWSSSLKWVQYGKEGFSHHIDILLHGANGPSLVEP